MKRCPTCQRTYADESLSFCRLDGTALAGSPTPFDSETTVDLSVTRRSFETSRQNLEPVPSMAALPFVHMSTDPEDEYFCDGLAEELLNALARIDGLKASVKRLRQAATPQRTSSRFLSLPAFLVSQLPESFSLFEAITTSE